ncbi:MAG: hypothetical protein WDO18_12365 [Acidobacteriota bacterium]
MKVLAKVAPPASTDALGDGGDQTSARRFAIRSSPVELPVWSAPASSR